VVLITHGVVDGVLRRAAGRTARDVDEVASSFRTAESMLLGDGAHLGRLERPPGP
jgi:hypothetical protein